MPTARTIELRELAGDSSSFLNQNPLWKPSYAVDGEFGLRELVKVALEG